MFQQVKSSGVIRTGLGTVLWQEFEEKKHLVLFISRKLTPAEKDYAALEQEAFAIQWAIKDLRYYLGGRHSTLVMDQAPLLWMAKAKNTNAQVTLWFLSFHDLFQVQHIAGNQLGNADGLLRRYDLWGRLLPGGGWEQRGALCQRCTKMKRIRSLP